MRVYPIPVSSSVTGIGYDCSLFRLRMYFGTDGRVSSIYEYGGVSPAQVAEIMFAVSVGSALASFKKAGHPFTKLEGASAAEAVNDLKGQIPLLINEGGANS